MRLSLAAHHNGFCCHCLAERMVKGNLEGSLGQLKYIKDCGGMKLYLIRGISGSGKSTYAKTLGIEHFEADMYFERDGEYKFDPKKLGEAHKWCQDKTRESMEAGRDVVVANTFIQKSWMKPYLDLAEEFGYDVEIKTMTGNYQNVHGVPPEKLEEMKRRFEP